MKKILYLTVAALSVSAAYSMCVPPNLPRCNCQFPKFENGTLSCGEDYCEKVGKKCMADGSCCTDLDIGGLNCCDKTGKNKETGFCCEELDETSCENGVVTNATTGCKECGNPCGECEAGKSCTYVVGSLENPNLTEPWYACCPTGQTAYISCYTGWGSCIEVCCDGHAHSNGRNGVCCAEGETWFLTTNSPEAGECCVNDPNEYNGTCCHLGYQPSADYYGSYETMDQAEPDLTLRSYQCCPEGYSYAAESSGCYKDIYVDTGCTNGYGCWYRTFGCDSSNSTDDDGYTYHACEDGQTDCCYEEFETCCKQDENGNWNPYIEIWTFSGCCK